MTQDEKDGTLYKDPPKYQTCPRCGREFLRIRQYQNGEIHECMSGSCTGFNAWLRRELWVPSGIRP
jgi:hypothetical protein